MSLPWVKKYTPKSTKDIIGQDTALETLKTFLKSRKKNALLLYGPPGCGKTAAAVALAEEFDLELLELNASDARNKAQIQSIIGTASKQASLFSKGKIILIDEIDGVSGRKDRGGIATLAKLISESSHPIIMTANNPWDSKYKGVRKAAQLIEFNPLSYKDVTTILTKILEKENIQCDEATLRILAMHEGGDLRGAINDLQTLSSSQTITREAVEELSDRKQTETIQAAITKVLKSTDPEIVRNAYQNVDEKLDEVLLWLEYNMPKEYTKAVDRERGFDALSKADVFNRRIRRWQHWRFLVYINALLSLGVAVAKDERYKTATQYKQTTRLLRIWQANMRNQKKKAIAEKLAEKTHCSIRDAIKNVPYLTQIYKHNKEMSQNLTNELDLDPDQVNWLKR